MVRVMTRPVPGSFVDMNDDHSSRVQRVVAAALLLKALVVVAAVMERMGWKIVGVGVVVVEVALVDALLDGNAPGPQETAGLRR